MNLYFLANFKSLKGASVYNSHLTSIPERLAVEPSLPVLTT